MFTWGGVVKGLRGGSVSLLPKRNEWAMFFFFQKHITLLLVFLVGGGRFQDANLTVAVHFFSGFTLTTKGPGQKIKLDRKTANQNF